MIARARRRVEAYDAAPETRSAVGRNPYAQHLGVAFTGKTLRHVTTACGAGRKPIGVPARPSSSFSFPPGGRRFGTRWSRRA